MPQQITRIGAAHAEATTVTIPTGHRWGDILIICAWRDASTTNPSIPAGWTSVSNTIDGTTCSMSIGWKFALSASETSGTWTNAVGVMCLVYRGLDPRVPIGWTGALGSASTATTLSWASTQTLTGQRAGGVWRAAFGAIIGVDSTTITTAPTGYTNITSTLGATSDFVSHDTNGPVHVGQAANTTAHGGASQNNLTAQIVLYPYQPQLENFKNPRSPGLAIGCVG